MASTMHLACSLWCSMMMGFRKRHREFLWQVGWRRWQGSMCFGGKWETMCKFVQIAGQEYEEPSNAAHLFWLHVDVQQYNSFVAIERLCEMQDLVDGTMARVHYGSRPQEMESALQEMKRCDFLVQKLDYTKLCIYRGYKSHQKKSILNIFF